MVKIDRRRKFLASTFLRALGISSNEDIKNKFRDVEADGKTNLSKTHLLKDETTDATEALIEIFKKCIPANRLFWIKSEKISSACSLITEDMIWEQSEDTKSTKN
jgi:DNA-directed RNA polymerase beta subunit